MSSGIYKKRTGYHNRRSIRLPGYDYSQPGYYFVTICIHDRTQNLFGNVIGCDFVGNEYAQIVHACWQDLPNHYRQIKLDEFVIMPNHIHGIIAICDTSDVVDVGAGVVEAGSIGAGSIGAGLKPAPTVDTQSTHTTVNNQKRHGLPEFIRAFKTFSSRRINENGQLFQWQRNYYEHIIRDENALYLIRKYIRENPLKWNNDSEKHIENELLDNPMCSGGNMLNSCGM